MWDWRLAGQSRVGRSGALVSDTGRHETHSGAYQLRDWARETDSSGCAGPPQFSTPRKFPSPEKTGAAGQGLSWLGELGVPCPGSYPRDR